MVKISSIHAALPPAVSWSLEFCVADLTIEHRLTSVLLEGDRVLEAFNFISIVCSSYTHRSGTMSLFMFRFGLFSAPVSVCEGTNCTMPALNEHIPDLHFLHPAITTQIHDLGVASG